LLLIQTTAETATYSIRGNTARKFTRRAEADSNFESSVRYAHIIGSSRCSTDAENDECVYIARSPKERRQGPKQEPKTAKRDEEAKPETAISAGAAEIKSEGYS